MSEESKVIDVKSYKIAATLKTEDGKSYDISSPSFSQLEKFEELKKSEDPAGIFKAFEVLGLPVEVGKTIPMGALQKIADMINPKGAEKK